MASLWIVHREETLRRGLARLAGAGEDTLAGSPADPVFDAAPAPSMVVLGIGGDMEPELEFTHRLIRRLGDATWILVGDAGDLERARNLFDSLPASFLTWPPEPGVLRSALRASDDGPHSEPLPLSQRPARDALSDRFSRAFSDLDLPELLRAMDPRLGSVPVLLLGEPGTGRATLARYLHHFGPTAGGVLVELRCSPSTHVGELLAALAASRHNPRSRQACTLWLADPERLPATLQQQVSGWVEFGPPAETLCSNTVRWIGTSSDEGLDASLRRTLGHLTLRIPPLRERPDLLPNLANQTASSWSATRGLPPRRLGEDALAVLEEYPWPGNLRELEAVVEQSLAGSANDPLGAEDLLVEGEPFAPIGGVAWSAPAGAPSAATDEPVVQAHFEPVDAPALPAQEAAALFEARSEPPARPEPPDEAGAEVRPGASDETAEPSTDAARQGGTGPDLLRLAAAMSHEVRNPLTAVRAGTELLPDRYADREFREQFAQVAGDGLGRLERVVSRLDRLASFSPPEAKLLDVCGLLEEVLDERRGRIHERRLLVLEELDRSRPQAECDPEQLRFALEALLDTAIELVPERGHIYLASRRNSVGLGGGPSVRVLLRFRGPQLGAEEAPAVGLTPATRSLDLVLAEVALHAQGATLTLDTSDGSETVILVDLPS